MKVTASISQSELNKFNKKINAWAKTQRKTNEEVFATVTESVAHQLVVNTYPLGATANKLKKFQNSVASQVFKGAMRSSRRDVRNAHAQSRNAKGKVPGRLYLAQGHPNFAKGGEQLIKDKKKMVGFLKAGWIVANKSISKVFNRVITFSRRYPSILSRHASQANLGKITKYVFFGKYTIGITNKVDYANEGNVRVDAAVERGYRTVLSRITKIFKSNKANI